MISETITVKQFGNDCVDSLSINTSGAIPKNLIGADAISF